MQASDTHGQHLSFDQRVTAAAIRASAKDDDTNNTSGVEVSLIATEGNCVPPSNQTYDVLPLKMTPSPPAQTFAYHDTSQTARPILGAYYPSWKIYSGDSPSQLRLDLLTHVYYAFARVDTSGEVIHLDKRADDEVSVDDSRGCLAALTKLKRERHPHLKILLSIGGGSGSQDFASVAADDEKRTRFCKTARTFVDSYELNGIDLDWEHPKSRQEGKDFVSLLTALRQHLPAPRYTITAAITVGEWCLKYIDLAQLVNVQASSLEEQPILDYLHVMTYDFAGPHTGQSGHHAQLRAPARPHNAFAKRSLVAVTEYLIEKRGLDPKKIVIGIPAYGRQFRSVSGPGETFGPGGESNGTIEYRQIACLGVEEVNRELGAASCRLEDGSWVSYDNPDIVRMKADFVKEKGLGGIFFWTGSYDAAEDERSLVVAAANVLHVEMKSD